MNCTSKELRRIGVTGLAFLGALGAASTAHAYKLERVFSYSQPAMQFNVLLQGADGQFYGTSQTGESGYGNVFTLDVFGNFVGIYDFFGADGYRPLAGLVQAPDGYLYGTTELGSNFNNTCGTAYRISTTGDRTTLFNFTGAGTRGCNPDDRLLLANDGFLYGTTPKRGKASADVGTVFKLSTAGAYTQIYEFAPDPISGAYLNGSLPGGGLIQGPDGALYGVAASGGANGSGVVFKISTAGVFTKLHDFSGSDGARPESGVSLGPDGALYGTTSGGGSIGAGTVFRVTTDGTSFTTLHVFDRYNDGLRPNGLLLAQDGLFYGTTYAGGPDRKGVLFSIATDGTFSLVRSFDGTTGKHPTTALVAAQDGALYGATDATIFRLVGVPTADAPIVNLGVLPNTVATGGSAQLTWTTSNAETCTGTGIKGTIKTQGSQYVFTDPSGPGGDVVYSLNCAGPGGGTLASASLHVVPPAPVVTLSASPTSLPVNTTTTLSWTASNAAACVGSGAWGGNKVKKGGSANVTKKVAGSYDYTLACTNITGTGSATATVVFQ